MSILTERAQSHLVTIPQALLAAAQHPKDHCWGVRNISFLALGSFSRIGKLLTNSWTSSGYAVYVLLSTPERSFLLGQHLQQCSAPPPPQLSSSESKATHVSGAMALSFSSWLHKSCTFSGTQERGAGEKAASIPIDNTNWKNPSYQWTLFFSECLFIHIFTQYVTSGSTSSIPLCSWRKALVSFKWIKAEGLFFSWQSSLVPKSICICVVQLQRGWMESRWQLCNLQRWKHPTERSLVPSEL